jgi:WG containing repeat
MTDTSADSGGFKYTSIERGSNGDDSTTKYTRKDKPNKYGYSKISVRQGSYYNEGILDINGKQLLPENIKFLVNSIQDTIALVQERLFKFVDLRRLAADPSYFKTIKGYNFAAPYSCGLAMVIINDRYFYINDTGEKVFSTDYDFAESFFADRALVVKKDHKFIIDTHGKVVANVPYDQISPYSDFVWQVIRVSKNVYKSGFINREGKEVVPLIYDEVIFYDPEFNRGLVRIKNKMGFLDEHGKVVIPVKYDDAEAFNRKGLSYVILDGRGFYIDVNGNEKEQD